MIIFNIRKRLSAQLLLYTLIFSFIFTILVVSIQLFFSYKQGKQEIEKVKELIEITYIEAITNSLYNFDTKQIDFQIRGLLNLRYIIDVNVVDFSYKPIARVSSENVEDIYIKKIYPLTVKKNKFLVGYLIVTFGKDLLYQKLKEEALNILLINSIIIFSIAIFLFKMVEIMIVNHINTITKYFEGFDFEDIGKKLCINRKSQVDDELDKVVSGINNMQKRIISGIDSLKEISKQLEESENKFRAFSAQTIVGIFALQEDKFIYVNEAAAAIFEHPVDEVLSWSVPYAISTFVHEDDRDFVVKQAYSKMKGLEGNVNSYNWRLVTSKKEVKWLEMFSKTIFISGKPADLVYIVDITEKKKMRDTMVQTEKMMSIGGLAAGMAHEINNPLSGIIQGVQNIRRRLNPELEKNQEFAEENSIDLENLIIYIKGRKIDKFLEGITESCLRASTIVTNMLQFSRKSKGEFENIFARELIEKVINIASNEYDLKERYDFKYINIKTDFSEKVNTVYCVRTEIEQVLFNILKNAAFAMFEGKTQDPEINIDCYKENKFVCISIQNNGPVIPDSVRKKIFDPFFTTKDVGKGTGLGLSVSYFIIVDNHKGEFIVESDDTLGTRFIIKLPS